MIHPAGVGSSLVGAFVTRNRWAALGQKVGVFLFTVEVAAYGLITGLVLLIIPDLWHIKFVPWSWIAAATAGGIVLFYGELLASQVQQRITAGGWAKKVVLRKEWDTSNLPFMIFFSVVIGTSEEIIFRQLLITLTLSVFGFSAWTAIVLSAACFALNHLRFGLKTVILKLLSGFAYSVLFVFSGQSIFPPIACHAAQNVFTLFALRKGVTRDA